MKYDVVVVAAGKAKRSELGFNKAFFVMKNNKTVLENACHLFVEDEDCENIIIVTNKENYELVFKNKKIKLTEGGKERINSVFNGLNLVESEYVLIHDAARPYLSKEALDKVKETLVKTDACLLAHASVDSVKYVENGKIVKSLDRDNIYLSETPQAFKTSLLKDCYSKSVDQVFTDEASMLGSLGYDVTIVVNTTNNKKLTYKEDFE